MKIDNAMNSTQRRQNFDFFVYILQNNTPLIVAEELQRHERIARHVEGWIYNALDIIL